MPKANKISQRKWIKGVVAASQKFAQPQGSFPRDSNLIYIRRGSLFTCDGSSLFSALGTAIQPASANLGPITDIFLYQPIGAANYYVALAKDFNTHLGAPTLNSVADGSAGVLNGTYKWVVTGLDNAGGETTASNEVTHTVVASHQATVTWTALTNATGYNIYRTVAGGGAGAEKLVATVGITTTYTDNTADGSLGTQTPPASDTTQVMQFYKLAAYGVAASVIKTLPADNLPVKDSTGGGYGGGSSSGSSGMQPPTPQGGVAGNISPIPLILQFNNLMILVLGNGIGPYQSDGTTGNTIQLVNNFQASYGSRAASTLQNVGDQISANVGGTNYIFTCTQAGTTGSGGAPSFSAVLGSIVVDGTVYWKNTGAVAAATAPRGAAHGIVYAGSLWLANTSPTTTSDNFDGPSCLKMSDLNNPNSWNPLNVAFLDRDDGTQITGLATFTLAESGIPPTGSLVVFKDFSTFQVNGVFGASNFSIQRAQTDLGCVAGRTIQFLAGFGIARMTHLGIAIFDGVRDRLLSEEIRPYIFGGQSDVPAVDWNFIYFAKATQTAQPPMYCCAVPLVPNNLTMPATPQLFQVASANTLTAGSYYIKVQAIFGNGSTELSSELGPVTVDGSHAFRVNFPTSLNGLVYKWRVFFGIGSGNETQYQDFAPAVSGTVTAPGLSGTPTSLNGQLNRLLCYDMVLKAWTIIDLPFPISTFRQFRSVGTIPITVMGGFSDGGVRRWLGGAGLDATWDAGATNAGAPDTNVRFSVRSPEVFGQNASDRAYFRQLMLRGTGSPSSLSATVTVSGTQGTTVQTINFTVLPMGNGEWTAYANIGVTGVDAYVTLQGSGSGVEIESIDWVAVAKDARARVAV